MNFSSHTRSVFLASAALGLLLATGIIGSARADGGNGGGSNGGAGGIGNSGAPGADAIGFAPGGGGGGAGGGGHGGKGGGPTGAAGGAGGTSVAPNGQAGLNGSFPNAAGGGGGGGFNGLGGSGGKGGNGTGETSSGTGTGTFDVIAGSGGGGGGGGSGAAGIGGFGGVGGDGGSGSLSITSHDPGVTVSVTHTGGAGGNGGDGGVGDVRTGSFTSGNNIAGGSGGAAGDGGNSTANATADGAGATANAHAIGGAGGKGGNGGTGLEVSGSNIVVVRDNGFIIGGGGNNGGRGGDATAAADGAAFASASVAAGAGGNGGNGGAGAAFSGSDVSFTNSRNLFGGSGGNGGSSGDTSLGAIPISNEGNGGQGGAGGVGVLFSGANSTFTNTSNVSGGSGGSGGAGGGFSTSNAGNGGNGGNAVTFAGTGSVLVNSGSITGGWGGDAGSGNRGNGGNGGSAVAFTASGGTVVNLAGGFISGGNGGVPSTGGTFGAAGYGIVGSGLTIDNSGTINGGLPGLPVFRADAIHLTGGNNFVSPGGTINGSISLEAGSLMPALPGSTVGPTLNISAGGLFLAAGSTYSIRVNGAANDSVAVQSLQGVNIAGANVLATISGSNAFGQHTILTSTFGVFGQFASVSLGNSAFLQAALSYDPNHVYLNITGNGAGGGIDLTTAAQTVNQFNVASALNSAGNANGFSGTLLNLIIQMSTSQARAAFSSLDGEVGTGAERAAFRFGDQFLNLMLNPFGDGRFNSAGGVTGFAPERQAELPPEMARAYAAVFKAPPPQTFEQRWSLWGAGFGGSGKTNGDPLVVGSTDTRLSTWGFAGGIDYRFSPYTVVGLAAAGGGTNWGLSNGLGNGRSESAQVGAYAKTRIGAAYIAESIAFANHWFTTDRTALGDNLRATFTGQSIGARIEGGYRFAATPNFGITPYAAAQAQAFHTGAYTETDLNNLGFGLSYVAKNATDVRTELGARFDSATLLNGTPLIFRARLAWAHDFVDTPSLNAAFQTLPLSNFTVLGAAIPQNSGLVSLGVDWYLNRDWKLLAKFDGEFAKSSELYAGTVALRYSW